MLSLLFGGRSLQSLTSRVRAFLGGDRGVSILDPSFSGTTAELARLLERWRLLTVDFSLQAASEREAQKAVLNSLREGLLAVNDERRVVISNSRLAEHFALSEDIVGKPLVQALRHSSVVAAFDRALEGIPVSESISVELVAGKRQLDMHVIPFNASTDIAAIALFIDVTRLTSLERIRRDFMADFSHEVRTPLAALRTAVETLESSRLTRAQEEKVRKVISRQLRRLERLVEDLSELAQIESGDLVLQREPVELSRLLRDLLDDFAERVQQRQITLVVEGDQTVANVDPTKVQQIFSNLIENAIKFSRTAATVRVVVEDAPDASIVRVVDEGEGIPPEEKERIFNRFYRIDKSRSQEVTGVGLGLAITKHLVLRHGGTIQVFSQPGKGSTFEVRLPKGDLRAYSLARNA